MNMRVLHLSMLYPPHIMGGAERSVAMIAEATTALGHEVAAACIAPEGQPPAERNGVTVYRMPHETDFWPEDWPKYSRPRRFMAKFKQQFNYAIERRFGEVLDRFRPDVVHTHSLLDISTRVWRAARERSIPIVHTLRDFNLVCSNASLFQDGKRCEHRHLKCQVLTFTKRFDHRLVDGVAGVGAEILQKHIDFGYFGHVREDLRRVIWNPAVVEGAGSGYVRPSREGKPFTFGYLGRINIEKGVGTLLDACRRLPAGDWRLVVAGTAVEGLERFVEMAGDRPVEFPGFLPPKQFFDEIDVLVVPSIWPEPLPRTILESYAVGVPVIGADSGGIPDLIGPGNSQWLYPPGDDAALADRMSRVLAAGRAALPTRADFEHVLTETTPELVAQRYLQFYRDVAASHGKRLPS
jgi:glycosyltransferase involved in cell wall biosynthesis